MSLVNVMHSAESCEHYTPSPIVEAAKATFKEDIDLDPASSKTANKIVKAKRFFTKEDDGLSKTWVAENVFLNPPGGKLKNQSYAALFWDKLWQAHLRGSVKQALFVGFSLEILSKRAGTILDFPICVPHAGRKTPDFITGSGRIMFLTPELIPNRSPTHGNIIVYLPPFKYPEDYRGNKNVFEYDEDSILRFASNFNSIGKIKL